jgi:inosine-uridine nucleoside N-ribohydrolase
MDDDGKKKQIWIDTDCGIDDLISILMILQHPSSQVLGLSIVHRNVALKQGLKNAQFINHLIQQGHFPLSQKNQPILIFKGCHGPLIKNLHPVYIWEGHHQDGMGGFSLSPEFEEFKVILLLYCLII